MAFCLLLTQGQDSSRSLQTQTRQTQTRTSETRSPRLFFCSVLAMARTHGARAVPAIALISPFPRSSHTEEKLTKLRPSAIAQLSIPNAERGHIVTETLFVERRLTDVPWMVALI